MFLLKKPAFIHLYDSFKESYSLRKNLLEHTPKERSLLRKLDLFRQGALSLNTFDYLLEIYAESPLVVEFVHSDEFALYFKSSFSFWTFDDEEPLYPERGFLTPDRFLAIDFHENYPYKDSLKLLIEKFYEEVGIERAYTYLFKILSEDHTSFEEEIYQKSLRELEEVGFPSYEKSLELKTFLRNSKQIDYYIKERIQLDPSMKEGLMENLTEERKQILEKNLYQTFSEFCVLQGNYTSLEEQEKIFLDFIQKALIYLKKNIAFPLTYFHFKDLFIIGRSLDLLQLEEKKLLKDSFYGDIFQEWVYKDKDILNAYKLLIQNLKNFVKNHLPSSYYNSGFLSFDLCFSTLFISWTLKKDMQNDKLGITIEELKDFVEKFMIKKEDFYLLKNKKILVKNFIEAHNLTHEEYLEELLDKEFEKQDFSSYTEKDYPYVGGVLLLKNGLH